MKTVTKLEWKRGRRDELETSSRMMWDSRCGRFRLERLESKFGLGTTFYAVELQDGREERIVYRGKSRAQAEAACRSAVYLAD